MRGRVTMPVSLARTHMRTPLRRSITPAAATLALCVVVAGSLIGCATRTQLVAPATAVAVALPAMPADTAWFAGQIAYTLPGGREVGRAGILVERRVEPAIALITEVVTTENRRPGAAPDRYEVRQQIAATGDRFTMREVAGAFDGEGSLSGDRWRWRAWQSTSRLPDGTRVESVDSLVADGQQLRVHKRVLGADGAVRISTVETLSRLQRAAYEVQLAAMRAKSP